MEQGQHGFCGGTDHHRHPYFGYEEDNGDYSGKYSLGIPGEPYDIQYNGSSEQGDKLDPISISRDPRDRSHTHRLQRLRSIRDLLYQCSK